MKKFLLMSVVVGVVFPFLVSASADPVPIHLTVITNDATLFDGDIVVDACLDSELGTSTSVNAFCAILQVASSSGWTIGTTWYPFGHSLDSINAYTPDFANNRYWIYYIDRAPGLSALNAYQLVPHQELLLMYGINPLRIVPATTTPEVGTTTLLRGEYFDPMLFDWVSATGTTYSINGDATTSDEFGSLLFIPSTTTPYIITLSRADALTSTPLTLSPYIPIVIATTTPPSETVPTGGSTAPDVTHVVDTSRAMSYLRSAANPDGLYGAELYNDWVAIGLSGVSGAEDIRAILLAHDKTQTDPGVLLTDLERRAMALEALGVDPRTGTSRNYISEMFAFEKNGVWGNKDEVNGDIFALFPLLHVGYTINDEVVVKTVATIVALQLPSGSWGNIDLTAAGVEVLAPLTSLPGVNNAITKALAYLHQSQGEDGGFGTSFATSWVIQALISLPSEDLSANWKKNGKTPQDYLWLLQQSDGGIEQVTLDKNLRVWATAYAIPAANGKSWQQLLGTYPRDIQALQSMGGGSEVLGASTTMPVILLVTASTTVVASTTTTTLLFTATSTPTISDESLSTLTPVKKSTKKVKKPSVKVRTKKTPNEALVIEATPLITVVTNEESSSLWKKIIIAPFARLFQELRVWLP